MNGSNKGAERRDWEHPRLVSLTASSETGNGSDPAVTESVTEVWTITPSYFTSVHGSVS